MNALSPEQISVFRDARMSVATVFPNLSFLISAVTLKGRLVSHTELYQWQPLAPDRIEVLSWLLVERSAPPAWKELSRQAYVLTFGPSGVFSQDDTENWTQITRNSRGPVAGRLGFIYEMGKDAQPTGAFAGPGEAYEGKYSEANARGFYRRWLDLLQEAVEA